MIKDISSKKDIHVLISSHILSDIESTCANVVILNKGRVAAQGELEALKQVDYSLYEMRIKGESEAFLPRLAGRAAAGSRRPRTGCIKVYVPPEVRPRRTSSGPPPGPASRSAISSKSRTSLEDLFARTVGVD